MRLLMVNLDVELFACCAKFGNQHVSIEAVPAGSADVDRALADVSLDNQDWGISFASFARKLF